MEQKNKEKVIIIGGGIAGLSAGIYALKAGLEAEIYEKNPVPGGECMGWNRKGYHIDNCIHWLTGTDPETGLWKVWKTVGAIDEETEYADIRRFYTSRSNGVEVTLWHDLDQTQEELIRIAPEDEAEIRKFIQYVRYAEDCDIPSIKPMDMMSLKEYMELGKSMANMQKVLKEYGNINCREMAKRFHSPVLQTLLCDYLPEDYTAYSLLVSYATMTRGNGKIPLKGSLAMTLRIAERFQQLGGVLHTSSPVRKILIEEKKAKGIRLEDGTAVHADYVISAVDTSFLFGTLVDKKYMPKCLAKAYEKRDAYPVTTGFQMAYAIDADFSAEDTLFFDCEPMTVGCSEIRRLSIKNYSYDRSFAPAGKTVLQVNVLQSDKDYAYWESLEKEAYAEKKKELAEKITKRIASEFPELSGRMELLDTWTPLTYNRYCNAFHGAYMGFLTAAGSKQLSFKGVVKGVKNLLIAGQWIMNPGGLPVAVVSGKFAVQRILKQKGKSIEV